MKTRFFGLKSLSVPPVLVLLSLPEAGATAQARPAPVGANTEAKRDPVAAPLGKAIPALNSQSSWEQNTRYEGKKPDKSKRGVYPVGNGRVFTYMGLGERANTMMAVSGPTYASPARRLPRGNFGEVTHDLGSHVLNAQKVRRVTDANCVVTEDSTAGGLALRTLTFAAPGSATITRVIDVVNGTGAKIPGLTLNTTVTGIAAKADGKNLVVSSGSGKYQRYAVLAIHKATADGAKLKVEIGDLDKGATFTTVMTVTAAMGEAKAGAAAAATDVGTATTQANATVAWWKKKIAPMPRLRTDHDKIMDLFKDWKILMLTMRDARSGVVTPMVTRRGAWLRESSGPLLAFLRYNMWDEAKALINYYYNAIRLTGELREYYPLDLDFSSLAGEETKWDDIKLPDSDLPSWFVIHHFWYYRSTHDARMIEEHNPFLLSCLKRQKRGKSSRMHFSGHENYMDATLYGMDIDEMDRNPLFIAEDAKNGRRSYSFASTLLFMVAIQGYGELMNGIDRLHNPKKWSGDTQEIDKPGDKWLQRSFSVMMEMERLFWCQKPGFPVRENVGKDLKHGDDWTGFFAPAISPVTGAPHTEPFANVNLLPLWIGFTFPTGERSRHNLRNSLGRLWKKKDANGKRTSALVGTTPTVGHFTGDVPGMLLHGLVERDSKDRYMLHEDIMWISEPAGEWGRFYNPDGRPIAGNDPEWPDRLSPNESGINIDAAIYALNGIRHANVPNFDNKAIKVKLRMPRGATFLEMENLKKDNRAFNVHVDEFYAPLSVDEKKQNDAQQDPRYKRDPTIEHRRFRFRMELISDNPPQGRYQVDADVSGTMFVRYLYRGSVGGESGLIQETEFWREDQEQFFIDGAPTTDRVPRQITLTKDADLLVLTNRPQCFENIGTQGVTYVDTGLPLGGPELVRAMLKDGKPTHKKLFLDIGYDAADSRTFKRKSFWNQPKWKEALQKFAAGGGEILTPKFVTKYQVKSGDSWSDVAAPEGRLTLAADGKPKTVRFTVTAAKARDDLILRFGTGCGYKLRLNGEEVAEETASRPSLRDQDAVLLEVKLGDNVVEIDLDNNGPQVVFVQVTDARGLPVK